jgi:hypothetical protein
MKNEFVPYDIALAMKELGFDDGCIAWYYHEELRYMNLEDDVPVKNNIELTGTYETDKYCYAAPLYQQAFRWLLEEVVNKEDYMITRNGGNADFWDGQVYGKHKKPALEN